MNKAPVTITQFMHRHELLSSQAYRGAEARFILGSSAHSRNYNPSQEYPRPVTDDEIIARNKFLKAKNARLRAENERNARLAFAEAENRAKANAEKLVRQLRGIPCG